MDIRSRIFNPQDFAWQSLMLTPTVAVYIRELVAKQPSMVGVRLGVKQKGCAGSGYVFNSASEPNKGDLLFEHDSTKLFVPLQAMSFIDGTKVDFVREGLNQIFRFHNPKAQSECGCGKGFEVQAVLRLVILG